jgi:dGTPase
MSLNLLSRGESERRERTSLCSHAALSSETLGRLHPEEEHPLRTAFQRDRDRLIHSTAFRRLEYKTQVFVNHEGDYYRTRLTHTLEVVQIARSLARFLRLNEDLAEAMALAHDLGHTPFGHSVETVLSELVEEEGGFEHNAQGLRTVDLLETPYPDFSGLNLTYEVRSIFTKKRTLGELLCQGFAARGSEKFLAGPTKQILEAQLVDLADSIAYNSHDVDDGMKSGLLSPEDLRGVPLWKDIWSGARGVDDSSRRHAAIRELINRQVTDAATESLKHMNGEIPTVELNDTGEYPPLGDIEYVIGFSEEMHQSNTTLKKALKQTLYRHPQVTRHMDRAREMIRRLFEAYSERPEQMAPQYRLRAESEPVYRVVCDYIAGMTDRFAEEEYISLFLPSSLVSRNR